MSRRLPDEYFRQTPSESPKARSEVTSVTPDPILRPPRRLYGMPATLVIACALAAFLIGFAGVRAVLLRHQEALSSPTPSVSSSQVRPAVPYTGRTRSVGALDAASTCAEGSRPGVLLDGTAETIWTCSGDGVEESITFQFGQPVDLVGVRLVAGNALDPGEAERERRITAVMWTFDDGSWVSQPLGNTTTLPQELRFPDTETLTVTLTIVAATEPAEDLDQVSISNVEFLTSM